jgi:hypothetical protein
MNRPNKLLLGILVMVALSCNALSRLLPISNPATLEPESPFVPTTSSNADTPADEASTSQVLDNAQSPCGASKWRIIAVSKDEQSSSPGLKKVYVNLAIENGSSTWGELNFYKAFDNPPYATTEGEFTYPGKIESGGRWFGGAINVTPREVPSGLTILGGAWGDNPEVPEVLTLSFEIAETQKSLSITFPYVAVLCYQPNGELVEDITSLTIDVDKDLRQTPDFSAQFEGVKSFTDSIDVKDVGKFEFLSATRELGDSSQVEYLTLRLKFTNASSGYKADGSIFAYLLSNDGLVHIQPGGNFANIIDFEAGPGLTSEVEFKFILFGNADKFALAIEQVVTHESYEAILVYQIYRIP